MRSITATTTAAALPITKKKTCTHARVQNIFNKWIQIKSNKQQEITYIYNHQVLQFFLDHAAHGVASTEHRTNDKVNNKKKSIEWMWNRKCEISQLIFKVNTNAPIFDKIIWNSAVLNHKLLSSMSLNLVPNCQCAKK